MKEIYYDELTGVYNRKFLHYWVDNEIKRANRFATKFAIILLDLDNFRDINNSYGHLEGDRVLVEFTKFLRQNIREVDSLVRYGGDEFIVLIPNTDTRGTLELTQRIHANLNASTILNHKLLSSIGFAVFPDDGTTIEMLINQADNLMYQAKKDGKNQIGLKTEIKKKLRIPSPLTIGRDDEANWCLNQLKDYKTIFIGGEAGVGKTRLVIEIKNRLKNAILLRANSYAALASVPYHPFRNMFGELLANDFGLVQRTLKQVPDICRSEIMKFFPEEGMPAMPKPEEMDKYRLFNSINTFIGRLSEMIAPSVLVLLIDDLHWTDRSSCELMEFIFRSIRDGIKIFGTFRIEEIKNSQAADFLGIWAREKLYTQIKLSPLNEPQMYRMLDAIMGGVSQSTARFIYEQSGGNPFYTEEILRELERRGKLQWNGREWLLPRDRELKIPTTIEETIIRKIKFLEPGTRYYLEIAAVLGQEFSADFMALATKRNVGEVLDEIDQLNKLGFIKERSPEVFFFNEDIVRQIVYRYISKSDLMKHHRQVGEAIIAFYHASLPNYYEQLAHHFTAANETNKALFYSKMAGFKCKDNYAHEQAIRFFSTALRYEDNIDEIFKIKSALAEIAYLAGDNENAIDHLDACLKMNPNDYKIYDRLGQVYENKGEYKNATRSYLEGLKITKGTDAQYSFMAGLAWVNVRLGLYQKTEEACEDILRKKKSVPPRDLAVTYVILGVVHLRHGDFKKSEFFLKQGLEIRTSLGDKKGMAACYIDLALVYQRTLNFKVCEELYQKALSLYEEIGYQSGILVSLLDLGALYSTYNIIKAEEYYLKGLEIAKLIGTKRDLALLYHNLGTVNMRRFMDDQAVSNFKLALAYTKETHFDEGYVSLNVDLSEFYRRRKQLKKGKTHLRKAQTLAQTLRSKYDLFDCATEEIEYLLLSGSLKKAEQVARKLAAQFHSETNVIYRVYCLLYLGKVAAAQKKYSQAQNYYDEALGFINALPSNLAAGEVYYLKGAAYKKERKFQEALNMFLTANKIFQEVGHLRYLDQIEHEIADVDISEK